MFDRFSGISALEHAKRNGQIHWVGGPRPSLNGAPQKASLPQRPGGVRPSLQRKGLGVVMTKPLCLCKLQREGDEARRAAE